MRHERSSFALCLFALCLISTTRLLSEPASEQRIILEEHLGYGWASDLVHRPIKVPQQGSLFPDKAVLEIGGKPVPFQWDRLEKHPDGSVQQGDIWFRTDLPAKGRRTLLLRPVRDGEQPGTSLKTDLEIKTERNILELRNALAAVRLPAGEWKQAEPAASPADAAVAQHLGLPEGGEGVPGPLLGVRLASGKWTAGSRLKPAVLLGYITEIVSQGPIFVHVRVTCRFANDGRYVLDVTLRQGEPLVRLDEHYEKLEAVMFDIGTNLQPAKFATKADFRGNMQLTPINYDEPTRLPSFVGWDYYLASLTSVLGLLGGPEDDLLGIVSTSADWMPVPYNQVMPLTAAPGPKLTLQGPLADGHRHWAFLVGKGADFPDPAKDIYRWWTKHVVAPLDKVANWQLVWPDMEKIEFPHTFFSKADLPGIRARLQAEPAIKELMEGIREGGHGWGDGIGAKSPDCHSQDIKDQFQEYENRYRPRKGVMKSMSKIGACALYFGDAVYLEQLKESIPGYEMNGMDYVDFFTKCYLEGVGVVTEGMVMASMQVSDSLLQRYVGMELLLGSDLLNPQEKREYLTKLAFAVYMMHEGEWQPPIHIPGTDERPDGYGQGTPNQKHCAFSCRAITACMLANHPEKQRWLDFAMAELRAHYPWTIAESGALLESPFYTSRDTMRYAPFWSAMTRAGVTGQEKWLNRP